jgi:serine phosphatase RsbU (regulator of sigma subunit)
VNAGHNAPVIFAHGVSRLLEATGLPLGLFADAEYERKTASLNLGDSLLLFTDGLTDSILGDDPEARVRIMLQGETDIKKTMLKLRSLVDPKLNCDDVTIVLVTRLSLPCATSTAYSASRPADG